MLLFLVSFLVPRILFEFIVRIAKPRSLKLDRRSPALKAAREMVKAQKRHFDFDVMKHIFVLEIFRKFVNNCAFGGSIDWDIEGRY